jgi:hypothetical protein
MKVQNEWIEGPHSLEKYLFKWIPYLCTNATPPEGVVFFFFYNKLEEDL